MPSRKPRPPKSDDDNFQPSPSPSPSPSYSPSPSPSHPSTSSPSSPSSSASASDPTAFPSVHSASLRHSYRIGRGEQGVLTFEPYKSTLLPLWRFKTVPIARSSSAALWRAFVRYDAAGDFVGMDMARKFIQMGMTRAKRYANYKGGRKYEVVHGEGDGEEKEGKGKGKGRGPQKEISQMHKGKEEKEEASLVFREVWERCKAHEGYRAKKEAFLAEQKEWDRKVKREEKEEKEGGKEAAKQAKGRGEVKVKEEGSEG